MRTIDLAPVPTWLLWIFAAAGYGLLLGVLARMMLPVLRRAWGKRVAFATVAVFGPLALAHDPRPALWFLRCGLRRQLSTASMDGQASR